jgi:preprotein translocase subunit SecD
MKRVAVVGAFALAGLLAAGCGGSHRCSGSELILRAVSTHGQPITPQELQIAQQIMQSRLNTLGVSSPTVAIKDGDEIVIHFLGAHDPAEAAKLVSVTGRLEMFDFEPSLAPPTVTASRQPAPLPSLYRLLEAVQKEASKGSPETYYLFKTTASHPVIAGPASTLHQLFRFRKGEKQPPHTEVLKVPAGREPVVCRGPNNCIGAGSNGTSKTRQYWYLLKEPAALTGKDLVDSDIGATTDANSSAPIVQLAFTGHGGKEFQRITKAEYDRGRFNAGQAGQLSTSDQNVINQYAGHNAIVLDGQLQSTPYIDYTDSNLSLGIPPGNGAQITEPSQAAARRMAFVLQSGSLPYTFERVGQTTCSR